MKIYYHLTAALLLVALTACTDPITVGSNLLGADRATVGETLDIPFRTRVVRGDSILTYDSQIFQRTQTVSFGRIEDPVFGTTDHSLYLTPTLPTGGDGLANVPQFARLASVRIDSAVLILPIDTFQAFYGPGREFPIRLTEYNEPFDFFQDYYSNVNFPSGSTSLSAADRLFPVVTPTLVHDTVVADSFLRSHLRIRFSEEFTRRIDDLPVTQYANDTVFREAFPGAYLESTAASQALLGLRPFPATGQSSFAGFYFYYTDTSGVETFYRAPLQSGLPRYARDYSGSEIADLIDDGQNSETVALDGQTGLYTEIEFTDLEPLRGRVINRAELTFPVVIREETDTAAYSLPARVELYYRDGSGDLQRIEDRVELIRSQANTTAANLLLGGLLEADDGGSFYSPLFSLHLQRIVDGEVPPRVLLRVTPSSGTQFRSARTLLNGPAAQQRPAGLRVTFTDLD